MVEVGAVSQPGGCLGQVRSHETLEQGSYSAGRERAAVTDSPGAPSSAFQDHTTKERL